MWHPMSRELCPSHFGEGQGSPASVGLLYWTCKSPASQCWLHPQSGCPMDSQHSLLCGGSCPWEVWCLSSATQSEGSEQGPCLILLLLKSTHFPLWAPVLELEAVVVVGNAVLAGCGSWLVHLPRTEKAWVPWVLSQ
jgi:hypothetical protein